MWLLLALCSEVTLPATRLVALQGKTLSPIPLPLTPWFCFCFWGVEGVELHQLNVGVLRVYFGSCAQGTIRVAGYQTQSGLQSEHPNYGSIALAQPYFMYKESFEVS